MKDDKLVNYVSNIEVRTTSKSLRGVFATRDIQRGELIAVERSMAEGHGETELISEEKLMERMLYIASYKNAYSIRLGYAYAGV